MKTSKHAVNELKNIVESSEIDPAMFPYKKGDKINIGSYSIKEKDGYYTIKSYVSNNIVAETYTKAAALAIAKLLSKKKPIREIIELDKTAGKYKNDCIFYKHTMNMTKDVHKWECIWIRYDVAKASRDNALDKIKKFIL